MPHRYPTFNWRFIGLYIALLGLMYFFILVYRNYIVISVQRSEIAALTAMSKGLAAEKGELLFISSALLVKEPFFYIKALREDWGFRKKGEKFLSELTSHRHICEGVPVHKIKPRRMTASSKPSNVLFFVVSGSIIAVIAFLLLFSVCQEDRSRSSATPGAQALLPRVKKKRKKAGKPGLSVDIEGKFDSELDGEGLYF